MAHIFNCQIRSGTTGEIYTSDIEAEDEKELRIKDGMLRITGDKIVGITGKSPAPVKEGEIPADVKLREERRLAAVAGVEMTKSVADIANQMRGGTTVEVQNAPPDQQRFVDSPMPPVKPPLPSAPKFKHYSAGGKKFRIDLNTQTLEIYDWVKIEGEELSDYGIMNEDGSITPITIPGFVCKKWIKAEDQ